MTMLFGLIFTSNKGASRIACSPFNSLVVAGVHTCMCRFQTEAVSPYNTRSCIPCSSFVRFYFIDSLVRFTTGYLFPHGRLRWSITTPTVSIASVQSLGITVTHPYFPPNYQQILKNVFKKAAEIPFLEVIGISHNLGQRTDSNRIILQSISYIKS